MTWSSSRGAVKGSAASRAGDEPRSHEWGEFGGVRGPRGRPATPEELAAMEERERREELESAYAQGFAQGSADGEARARIALRSAVDAVQRALAEIQRDREEWQERADDNVMALALVVARQIVDRELATDPGIFADLVRKALADFPPDQPVRIRLNPQDLSNISAISEEEGGAPITGGREAQWIPDADVVRGGCVVEGPDRILDGRVDVCLDRVYWALNE